MACSWAQEVIGDAYFISSGCPIEVGLGLDCLKRSQEHEAADQYAMRAVEAARKTRCRLDLGPRLVLEGFPWPRSTFCFIVLKMNRLESFKT